MLPKLASWMLGASLYGLMLLDYLSIFLLYSNVIKQNERPLIIFLY
ncbi:hypothetical protein HMPREF9997_02422 [Corynebacterium durum F0235]|uniref:Uncharacterized protein n=1 Tax=Corynebacterium durum F0235 TaxID=1035195 RepID=L1MAN7_9CORY|nr:hypothetical protein HMPREF9997_02422 [Corynebacterium durum F0235]